jgi:hypothetical protein
LAELVLLASSAVECIDRPTQQQQQIRSLRVTLPETLCGARSLPRVSVLPGDRKMPLEGLGSWFLFFRFFFPLCARMLYLRIPWPMILSTLACPQPGPKMHENRLDQTDGSSSGYGSHHPKKYCTEAAKEH